MFQNQSPYCSKNGLSRPLSSRNCARCCDVPNGSAASAALRGVGGAATLVEQPLELRVVELPEVDRRSLVPPHVLGIGIVTRVIAPQQHAELAAQRGVDERGLVLDLQGGVDARLRELLLQELGFLAVLGLVRRLEHDAELS